MPPTTDIFPPFPADLVECRVQGLSQSVDWVNVLFAIRDGGGSFASDAAEIATALFTFYEGIAAQSAGTFWSVTDIVLLDRSVANGPELVATPGAPIVGDETAEALPLQTQLCITWRTANTGRRYRGRSFINGWTADSNTAGGQPETATINAIQGLVDDLVTDLAANGHTLAVLSRGRAGDPDSSKNWEGFATPVTSGLVRGGWDVLRSRRT